MNILRIQPAISEPAFPPFLKLTALCAAMLLVAACASAPEAPAGSAAVRAQLTSLRTNAELASRAPVEIQAAEVAVVAAERPRKNEEALGQHLVLIADQKVQIANAWAQSRLHEDQRVELSARSDAMRLEARTREADRARQDASAARSSADIARDQAAVARSDANAARSDTDFARQQAAIAQTDASSARTDADLARTDADRARAETEELQREITALNAQITDRGLVVTLGDVLFETGNSQLRGGIPSNLDKLAGFLKRFDTRTVIIEGHTDSVGSDASNIILSQRRAASVQSYLVGQGIAAARISAEGKGEGSPVADNQSETGRQQNRRVEVIISNQQ